MEGESGETNERGREKAKGWRGGRGLKGKGRTFNCDLALTFFPRLVTIALSNSFSTLIARTGLMWPL